MPITMCHFWLGLFMHTIRLVLSKHRCTLSSRITFQKDVFTLQQLRVGVLYCTPVIFTLRTRTKIPLQWSFHR